MSKTAQLTLGGMTFEQHGEKGWFHDASSEWCSQTENIYLDEILQRESQLTALREAGKELRKQAREFTAIAGEPNYSKLSAAIDKWTAALSDQEEGS